VNRTAHPAHTTHTSRRTIVLGAGAALGAAALAACGAQSGGQSGQSSGAKVAQPVTLDWQHRWDGVREPLAAAQVEAFKKLQPNITVNNQMVLTSAPGNAGGMPADKILAQITAGTPPDVVMMQSTVVAQWAVQGGAMKLDDLLKRDKIAPDTTFYPALAKMAQTRGAYHGLPQLTQGDWSYLYMNAEALQSVGLDPKKPPTTWDELATQTTRLTQKSGDSFTRVGLPTPAHGGLNFANWMLLNDGKLLSDDGAKVAFESAQGVETLEWMRDFTNRVYGSKAAVDKYVAEVQNAATTGQGTNANIPRYQGKIGMWTETVAFFFIMQNEATKFNPSFQYGAGLIPHNAKNTRARPQYLADVVWLYFMPQGGKKTDAAWEWLKYLTVGDGNKQFVLAQGRPSPVQKINDHPAFPKVNPHWEVVKKALSASVALPQTPAWGMVNGAINRSVAKVLAGELAPKEALAQAAQEGQQALDDTRR
jgi:multiple sugar transport system substrate-binding protein